MTSADKGVDLGMDGRTRAERALFHVCRCGHYRYLHTGAWWASENPSDVGRPCRRPIGSRVPECPCKGFKRDRAAEGEGRADERF